RDSGGDRRVHQRRVLAVDEAAPVDTGRAAVEREQAVLSDERGAIDPATQVAVVDGVVVRIHLARARGIVGWTQVRAVHAGIGAVLGDVLGERLRGAVVRAVAAVRGERA